MHELSVALAIVEAAEVKAAELGCRVDVVHVRVGPLSGVVPDALQLAFQMAVAESALRDARLEISTEEVVAWCSRCAGERPVVDIQHRRCAECGALAERLVSGDALQLVAIEVSDDVAAHR